MIGERVKLKLNIVLYLHWHMTGCLHLLCFLGQIKYPTSYHCLHVQQLGSHRLLEWRTRKVQLEIRYIFNIKIKKRTFDAPASEKVLFQVLRYCALTGQGRIKEKANTMVRQMNKDRKKIAVLQWVRLGTPTFLEFSLCSDADGAVSAPSSLLRGSASVGCSVDSIGASTHYQLTNLQI